MSPLSQSTKLISENFHKGKNKVSRRDKTSEMKVIRNVAKILDFNGIDHSSQVLCLPDHVSQLSSNLNELEITNLKKLQISNTSLIELSNSIEKLKNLSALNLSSNDLKELPDSLSDLKNLVSLNLSHNELSDLPISYSKLQRLRELDISHNHFRSLPKCIADGMGVLRILDISSNVGIKMNIIPYGKYLEKFYARENRNCGKFPDWILTPKFFNITEFSFDGTSFDVFNFIGKQSEVHLTSLSMTCSNLSNHVLEMMLDNMISLEKINVGNENQFVSGNIFNSIPIEILKCPQMITEINFRNTVLPSIPSSIKQLSNLKMLDIGLNCVTWLPNEFCSLHKLESLKIDGNGFIMFPENFGDLSSLQELRAENNIIVRLPESFKNLKALKFFDLYNNEIEEFPSVLHEIVSLEGLDVEQNYCLTNNIKMGEKSYDDLHQAFRSYIQFEIQGYYDIRHGGAKQKEEPELDELDYCYNYEYLSEEDGEDSIIYKKKDENEENWDESTDNDDEFDPESEESSYKNSKQHSRLLAPLGFCPADLHSERIRREVSSMRVYGSLPSFKIEEGQFDDA